ncbi:hypothetical protein P3T73_18320 [Kiritimatiellota bacterium B12222]|nr:hypothetical protein P3T73_18320 [Kiritimatiellota bacterium B12222]
MKKVCILSVSLLLLAACRQESSVVELVTETPVALTRVFQLVDAQGVSSLTDLHAAAKPGDEVVFEAKVMGSKTPFVEGRALMVVGDESHLVSCDLMEEEGHCETPWDVCCATREDLLSGSATVQVVDENGKVLSADLRGVHGLQELSRVRVSGVVSALSSPQALLINATAIEVLP